MKKTRIGYIVGAVLMMLVIFYSSSQTYGEQDMRSELGMIFEHPFWENIFSPISFTYVGSEISVATLGVSGFVEFFVRKFAHLFVYFCLAFFITGIMRYFIKEKKKYILFSLLFVVLYAILDEVHQYYTGDRTPLWQDVVIDSIGGFIGIVFFSLLRKYKVHKSKSI